MSAGTLAVHGGPPVRTRPFPPRRLFAEAELEAVRAAFEESWRLERDFGFQDVFEDRYCRDFVRYQEEPGFADAVCNGSAAVYLAVKALGLEPGCEALCSPVTDAGAVSAMIMAGCRLRLMDARPGTWNAGLPEFLEALTPNTRLAVVTHTAGFPCDIGAIAAACAERGVRLVEDCSQAHGARRDGRRVGCFGDTAAFSTMFSKLHATGGTGGVVYTRDEALYWRARAQADRGKPFHAPDFDPKDPAHFDGPALNFNQNALSCVIGSATLRKLDATLARRREITGRINAALGDCRFLRGLEADPQAECAPFFHTIVVDAADLPGGKAAVARAVAAEGIPINPDYRYLVADWPWVRPYLAGAPDAAGPDTSRARAFRDASFNLLFTEAFSDADVADVIEALRKVDKAFAS